VRPGYKQMFSDLSLNPDPDPDPDINSNVDPDLTLTVPLTLTQAAHLHVLHHEPGARVVRAGAVELHDVGVEADLLHDRDLAPHLEADNSEFAWSK